MFKRIRSLLRKWYMRRLFLRIYFARLENPNQNLNSLLADAYDDLDDIRCMMDRMDGLRRD